MTRTESPIGQWLESLGAIAGIRVSLDATGSADIELASGAIVAIEVDAEADTLLLSADLFSAGQFERMEVLERAMRLNHLGRGTGGATLGWDADRTMLVLSAIVAARLLDEDGFLSLLSGFIELVDTFANGLPATASVSETGTQSIPPLMLKA